MAACARLLQPVLRNCAAVVKTNRNRQKKLQLILQILCHPCCDAVEIMCQQHISKVLLKRHIPAGYYGALQAVQVRQVCGDRARQNTMLLDAILTSRALVTRTDNNMFHRTYLAGAAVSSPGRGTFVCHSAPLISTSQSAVATRVRKQNRLHASTTEKGARENPSDLCASE